jgi:hypothetical protein
MSAIKVYLEDCVADRDSNIDRGKNYQQCEEDSHRERDHGPSRGWNFELNQMMSSLVVGIHSIHTFKITRAAALGIAAAPEQVVRFEGQSEHHRQTQLTL